MAIYCKAQELPNISPSKEYNYTEMKIKTLVSIGSQWNRVID